MNCCASDDGSAKDHIDGHGEDQVDHGDLQNFIPGQKDSVQVYGVYM